MPAPTPAEGQAPWIRSTWGNYYTIGMLVVAPVLTALLGVGFVLLVGVDQVGGAAIAGAIIVGIPVVAIPVDVFMLETSKPSAIQVYGGGVAVRTFRGRIEEVPWTNLSLGAGASRGWGTLRVGEPIHRSYLLEPSQYATIRAASPVPSPGRS